MWGWEREEHEREIIPYPFSIPPLSLPILNLSTKSFFNIFRIIYFHLFIFFFGFCLIKLNFIAAKCCVKLLLQQNDDLLLSSSPAAADLACSVGFLIYLNLNLFACLSRPPRCPLLFIDPTVRVCCVCVCALCVCFVCVLCVFVCCFKCCQCIFLGSFV